MRLLVLHLHLLLLVLRAGLAQILAAALWLLYEGGDWLLTRAARYTGKFLFFVFVGDRYGRPRGLWRTFYFVNAVPLAAFWFLRMVWILTSDLSAVLAALFLGGSLSWRYACRGIWEDVCYTAESHSPWPSLRNAFERE